MGQHLPFSLDVLSDRFLACTACRKSKFGKGQPWVLPAPPNGVFDGRSRPFAFQCCGHYKIVGGICQRRRAASRGYDPVPSLPAACFPEAFAARFYAMGKVQKRGVSTIVTNCICSISKKNGQRRFFQKADLVRLVARAFVRGSLLQANLIAEEGCKVDTPFPGPWKHISRHPRMLYWF